MKIYAAGKTHQYEQVREVQRFCRNRGHFITFDWTETVEVNGPDSGHEFSNLSSEFKRECAENDFLGVTSSDLVIALVDDPRIMGTMAEIGIGLALYKEIWLVGIPDRDSVFFHMPQIKEKFESLEEFLHEGGTVLPDIRTSGVGFPD